MPTISLTFTTQQATDAEASIDRLYGSAVTGMTPKQKLRFHIVTTLTPQLKAIKKAAVNTTTADATIETANTNIASALASIASAKATAEAAAVASLEGIS